MMMTTKRAVLAAVAALLISACGGSDEPAAVDSPDATTSVEAETEPTEPVETESTADGESCSLSTEQIGDDTISIVGSYLIDGDQLLCDPSDETSDTFGLFTSLTPPEYREGVVAFVAIDQEESDGTDGAMQDVVGPGGEPTGERYLALDVTGSSVELERTIVHEVGHTIFIKAGSDEETVYSADFNAQFPPGASYADAPEDFVTEYAASEPGGTEDMAESWAMYVFGDTQFAGDADDDGELDVVVPGTVAAEKVAFFANYPELFALRDEILAGAGL